MAKQAFQTCVKRRQEMPRAGKEWRHPEAPRFLQRGESLP
jgi:hypothetical protein